MTAILTSASYPAVRALLDVTMTTTDLPDATIALDAYAGSADRRVKAADPLWASRTDDAALALVEAACCYCAAALVLALPHTIKESFGRRDYEYTKAGPTPAELAKGLRARASAALAYARGDDASGLPTFFTTAPGDRVRDPNSARTIPLGSTILGTP